MRIGLSFDEYVELRLAPLAGADPAFVQAAEMERKSLFPMTVNQAAEHLRSRGYDCKPQMLELLVENGVVRLSSPDAWTRADVDAAADYFEDAEIFTPYTEPGEDGAVPYFWPIGDKHILVFASHKRGSQYLLGDYDRTSHKFQPLSHGRFNFGTIGPGGVHAPSATPDGKGGVYVIHNVNEARPTAGWNHLMSLVRVLTLRKDNTLGIEPVAAVETLRRDKRSVGQQILPAGREIVLANIAGNALEIQAEIDPRGANEICLTVLRSPAKEEATEIRFRRNGYVTAEASGRKVTRDAILIDPTHASLHRDVQHRPPEVAPFELPKGELLTLRIFVDRSIVEVFAGGRQCVALRVYPQRPDSVGVSLSAQNPDALLRRLDAWQMKSIYATASD